MVVLQPNPADLRILALLAEGHSHATIAAQLGRTQEAITSASGRICERMGAVNSRHAIALAVRAGWLPVPDFSLPTEFRPNALLPCGTESARRRHLARTEWCLKCGVEGSRIPESAISTWDLPFARAAA